MEIPELIRQRLGDETLESAVNLGDEDLICFTPTRTLVYQGEGLLSDDSIEEYSHEVERLDVSEGRRKMAFTLTYVDEKRQFSVPRDRGEDVLERLLGGILGTADVIEDDESVQGVFRFSELTLVITDARLVKHVGMYVLDSDFEEYPFSKVTGLEFEKGSVATQIVISIDGRPERIKAPSQDAKLVQHTLTEALFDFYDVETLEQLNDRVGENGEEESTEGLVSSDIELDDTISPLVGPDDEDDSLETDPGSDIAPSGAGASIESGSNASREAQSETSGKGSDRDSQVDQSTNAVDPEEFEAMKDRLETLSTAVKRQNKLLKKQHRTINDLVEELKRQQ